MLAKYWRGTGSTGLFWVIYAPFANDVRTGSCTNDCCSYAYEGCSGASRNSRHDRAPENPVVEAGRLCACRLSIFAVRGMGVNGLGPSGKPNA